MTLFRRGPSLTEQNRDFYSGDEAALARRPASPFDPARDAPLSANDDAPGVMLMLEKAGFAGRQVSKLTIAISILGGIFLGGVLMTVVNWTSNNAPFVGNGLVIVALAVPMATLALLFLITNQFFQLASSLKRAQDLEKRLDRAGQISALSRELEQEAAHIETRIERFLSVGVGLRQELKRDHEFIEQAYSDKITQTRAAIRDLEAARLVFLDDVDNVNKALHISRDFISAKIASLTSDFEDSALSAARVLDSNMMQIAQKFKAIIVKDAVRQESVDRLISANEKTIELINRVPDVFHGHVQDAVKKVEGDLEKNVDRLTAQIESLSDNISRSNVDLVKNLADTPAQIESYVSNLHTVINSAFEQNSRTYSNHLNQVSTQTTGFVEHLQDFVTSLPSKIEAGLVGIEPDMMRIFEDRIADANTRISQSIKPLLDASASLDAALRESPDKLQSYLAEVGPVIDAQFASNAREFETRLTEAHARQVELGRNFAEQLKAQFDELTARVNHINPEIRTNFDAIIRDLDQHIAGVTATVETMLAQHKDKLDAANMVAQNDIGTALADQTLKTKTQIETASQILQETLANSLSQQELRSQEFEAQFVGLIEEFKRAKNDLQNLPIDLSGAIQNQVKSLDNSIEIVLSRFNSALLSNQDLAAKAMAGQLTTTQQNLSHEYSLIEGRLFRSLSNFNEVVKNCITALEEASTWRLDAFDGQIKAVSDENLEDVRKEFESLAERMKLKVGELKLESSIIEAAHGAEMDSRTLGQEQTPPAQAAFDPNNPIEKLSERLANIDAILHELRAGSR